VNTHKTKEVKTSIDRIGSIFALKIEFKNGMKALSLQVPDTSNFAHKDIWQNTGAPLRIWNANQQRLLLRKAINYINRGY